MTAVAFFSAARAHKRAMTGEPLAGLTQPEVDALNAVIAQWKPEGEVRRIGPKGLALIKRFEGLRLKAYRCPADVPTIGYGSTGPHVRMGMAITEEEAEKLLQDDLRRFETGVAEMGGEMTPGQFSALVALSFNVGLAALSNSTLLRKHLSGDHQGAADQFLRWNRAGGRVLPGLVTRRAAEAALFRGQA